MLEPLIITEDGDTTTGEAASSSDAILRSCGEDSALEKKEEHPGEGENNEAAPRFQYFYVSPFLIVKTPLNYFFFFFPVVFSSMTSLQKEEFFDLVATAQARRLDDQRAQLGDVPAPKDDLYDMILTTQAQGRLEDQRSRAPGPMDDEDFFSLLLKVQGGRMDEQRTELPRLLKT
uniref:G protein signaling modulator 1a n=1 Tax=Poecilia latipinna TaxID=48699 RepID=A0A3B3UC30_9TELE